MRKPIFVRPLTEDEGDRLEDGLHSADSFILRRCQMLLASARGVRVPQIAATLGCDDQTVRDVIRAFKTAGLDACLTRRSSRPHRPHCKVDAAAAENLRPLVHQSPRTFGKPTSIWPSELPPQLPSPHPITATPA